MWREYLRSEQPDSRWIPVTFHSPFPSLLDAITSAELSIAIVGPYEQDEATTSSASKSIVARSAGSTAARGNSACAHPAHVARSSTASSQCGQGTVGLQPRRGRRRNLGRSQRQRRRGRGAASSSKGISEAFTVDAPTLDFSFAESDNELPLFISTPQSKTHGCILMRQALTQYVHPGLPPIEMV